MKKYIEPNKIEQLSEELDMPEEVTAKLRHCIEVADYSMVEPYFNGLFCLETGEKAAKAIKEWGQGQDKSGICALSVYLVAALRSWKIYEELGIGRDIYLDTMKVFSRFVGEHKESFGEYGFDRDFWIYRQLSASLFRLGTLEFEMVHMDREWAEERNDPEKIGTPVLSVHIPSNAVMTREGLDNSYRLAQEFFPRFFPAFLYEDAYCSTWLLSPYLKELLPPTSRILLFQSDYEILNVDEEDKSFMTWVYKREYGDYMLLPEDTSLMRAVKQRLLSGGKIGSASGVVKSL